MFRTFRILAFTPVQSLIATKASAGTGPVAYVVATDGIASLYTQLLHFTSDIV
jgi:hypothetical protein